MPENQIDTENCTPISNKMIQELWTVFRSETTLQACRQVIVSRLLSGGIAYADERGGELVNEDFYDHVQRHFVPFARDVVDALCVQGFAAFTLDAKSSIPISVPPGVGQYWVRVDPKSYARTLIMEDMRTARVNTRVLFFVENWPIEGCLVSPVASYRRMYGFKSMVEMNVATADFHAARPIIFATSDSSHAFNPHWIYNDPIGMAVDKNPSEYKNQKYDGDNENFQRFPRRVKDGGDNVASNVTWDGYDHRSLIRQRAEAALQHSRILNEANSASEYHEKLAEDLNSGRLHSKDVRIDPSTGLPVFHVSMRDLRMEVKDNVIQMPMDSKILAEVKPSSRTDLVPILEHSTRQACICMGVPPSGLGVGGTHTTLEAAASEGVLKSTLQRFRRSVTRCLLDVYVGLHGKKDNLSVFFPSLLNTNTARSLFMDHILTYEAFCEHFRTVYSIPHKNIVDASQYIGQQEHARPAKRYKEASDADDLKAETI